MTAVYGKEPKSVPSLRTHLTGVASALGLLQPQPPHERPLTTCECVSVDDINSSQKDSHLNPFMVVATFKPGTHMPDVFAVVPEEQERVRQLQAEGRVNTVYLATAARQTVFLESFGNDIDDVLAMVNTLPMAKWWDIDVFPLNPPAEVPGK